MHSKNKATVISCCITTVDGSYEPDDIGPGPETCSDTIEVSCLLTLRGVCEHIRDARILASAIGKDDRRMIGSKILYYVCLLGSMGYDDVIALGNELHDGGPGSHRVLLFTEADNNIASPLLYLQQRGVHALKPLPVIDSALADQGNANLFIRGFLLICLGKPKRKRQERAAC